MTSFFTSLYLTQIFSAISRQNKSAFQCPAKNLEQMLIADARRLFLGINKNILKNYLYLLVFIFVPVDSGHKSCKKRRPLFCGPPSALITTGATSRPLSWPFVALWQVEAMPILDCR